MSLYNVCVCVCYLPSPFSDVTQSHRLFDLSQRQHHSEARQGGQPWISHVVVGEIAVGILVAQLRWKYTDTNNYFPGNGHKLQSITL